MDGDCFTTSCDGKGTPAAAQFGGTSLAAPAWAGIAKLVAQQNNTARLGSVNTGLYQLANSANAATVFQDITSGNNNFNGVTGYTAGVGFDLATGWGNVDINALATAFFANVTPLGPQVMTVSPKSLAFGNVDYAVAGAATKVRRLTITNPAKYKAAAIISSIVGAAGFSADSACVNATIAPGGKLVCNITYVPTGLGGASGTLTINDNVPGGSQTIALTRRGNPGQVDRDPGHTQFRQGTSSIRRAPPRS